MGRILAFLFSVCALVTLSSIDAAAGEARVITVDEAVAMAIAQNASLQAARARLEAGQAAASSTARRLAPAIHLSDEYQHYNDAFIVPMGGGAVFPVRKQDTNLFTVAADQPLLGLLRLSADYESQQKGSEAGAAQVQSAELSLRQAVETLYLRVFEAKALEGTALASERELNDRLEVARAQLTTGVLTEADVLRVQVAAANARQQAIQAHSQELVSRAGLLALMGLPADDAGVTFVEPKSLLESGQKRPEPAAAQDQALSGRPEILQTRLSLEAGEHQRRARLYALLPEIDLEGAYLRSYGQIVLPTNSEFVGINAKWAIWEWGASYAAYRASQAQARAAAFDLESQKQQVRAEVTSGMAQLDAAASAISVAEQTIASAEEAYRVTQAQLQAGTATTTDLLEAQSALTQSRLNYLRAQYELAISRVNLRRALGR
ncbi:MAG: TolC family protein [Polyangia bacterium]